MNAEQKKRIAHEISNWKNACNCRAVQLTGDRMAALLQGLIDAPEEIVPAELPAWENGDDPLVGGGLISRGKVDFTALGIWPSKPAPDAEPVAYVTGYYAGYLSIATIDGRVLPAGTALFTAPPAPSVPPVRSTGQWESSRIADYNRGWNDCREATEKALNDSEKRN